MCGTTLVVSAGDMDHPSPSGRRSLILPGKVSQPGRWVHGECEDQKPCGQSQFGMPPEIHTNH